MKHKWNEEEFNHIAYAYRLCPLQDVEMVSQRYKELVDYVLNVFDYSKQQTKELKCLNVYSVDGEIKLFENITLVAVVYPVPELTGMIPSGNARPPGFNGLRYKSAAPLPLHPCT